MGSKPVTSTLQLFFAGRSLSRSRGAISGSLRDGVAVRHLNQEVMSQQPPRHRHLRHPSLATGPSDPTCGLGLARQPRYATAVAPAAGAIDQGQSNANGAKGLWPMPCPFHKACLSSHSPGLRLRALLRHASSKVRVKLPSYRTLLQWKDCC